MRRLFILSLLAISLSANAQYQITNSDFESWTASSGEPDHWHGFKSAKGTFASFAQGKLEKSEEKRPGSTGSYSAVITSGIVGNIVNNGSVTTGQLNAGSMKADDSANHAEMDKTSTATDKNGDKFYMPLTGYPDAIRFWLKFSQGTPNSNFPYASVKAVITDGTYYQDPEDKNYTNKVAQALNNKITTCDWTEFTLPFDYDSYTSNAKQPAAILCTFGTNATPGKGSKGDQVYIDDLELIYFSELASAQYNGSNVAFTDGAATVDAEYDPSLLILTKKGRGGQIEVKYDDASALLTITVNGDNISEDTTNYHTYTIQFKAAQAGPQVVFSKNYTEDLYVTLGTSTEDKLTANVTVETLDNGNINFVLKNFTLGVLPIGNIAVTDVNVASDNSFSFSGGIKITEGDADYGPWMGPGITEVCEGSVPIDMKGQFIGENHVVAYISINIEEFVGYPVEVHLGYAHATMAVKAEAQYGTFCAPFEVDVPEGVSASTVSSVVDNVLTLTEVGAKIPANTPVILYAEAGLEAVDAFGIVEEVTPAVTPEYGLLTGVYEATAAPVGSYVLQNINDKVGFYQVAAGSQPTVGANRAYLTVASGIKAFYFDEDDATAIKGINVAEDAENIIFNVNGQRIGKMQRGINIVNGKKILK